MFQFVKPSKADLVALAEHVAVTFVVSFVAVWAVVPNPFSKAGAVAGVAAGINAVYRLLRGE